jgi:PAS domain S-box-containing protein
MGSTEAKRLLAEKGLQDKENIYKFLLDNSKEIVLILSKSGKILLANKAALNSFGYSEEEILGKSITRFLTKDSLRKSLYALAQEFLGQAQPEMEVKAKTKLGELRYLRIAMGSAPIYDREKIIGVMVCGSDLTELRKREKDIERTEKRFRELWDKAPVAYHTLDTNGMITDVNETEARMLGYTKEQMIGKSIFTFILPEQQAEAQKRFQQKISGQKVSKAENRMYVRKDGAKIYVSIDDVLERDKSGKIIGVWTTMVDITERKLAEEALEESEERFRSVVEHSHEGIFIVDDAYRFIYCNDELSRILGYFPEEIRGQDFREFLADESKQLVADRYIRRQKGENIPPRYEFDIVRKDRKKRRVEISSAVIKDSSGKTKTVAEILDITEGKCAEEALRESEEKYRTLTENVNLGIYRNTIGPKGRFLEANPAIIKMFGYESKEEFLAINVSDLYQNAEDRKKFNEKILSKGLVSDEELQLKKKDGTPFVGSISAVAVKDEQGNVEYYDGIIEDITERKKAVEALWESEEKFRNLAEQSPNMIFINRQGRVVYANKRCEEITGYKRVEIYSPEFDFRMMIAPESRDMVIANFSKHLKGFEVSSYEYVLLTKEGKRIDAILATKLTNYENEKAILGIVTDITKQKKADKIRDSVYKISEAAHSAQNLEDLFRLIHEVIRELMPANNFYISLYDYDKEILSFPYFADEYDETPAPQRLGKGLTEYVLRSGEPLLASPEVFDELVSKGEVESIGTPSIDWLGVPLKTENKVFGVLVVQSYVEGIRFGEEEKEILKFVSDQIAMAIKRKHAEEQLKKSLREKETLLQEIHHRVKNNMQIISSLLNLQANQIKDNDFVKIIKVCQSRIRSMALVHEKLYLSRDLAKIDFSDYVESLIAHLFQFNQVNSDLVHLKMNLEDVFLDIQTAIPCGLILNELVTNSLKHAFPEGSGGEIIVEMHPLEQHAVQIVVKDNGRGMPKDLDIKRPIGMGLQIVNMLVNQLEGSIEVQRNGGTIVRIVIKESIYKSRI